MIFCKRQIIIGTDISFRSLASRVLIKVFRLRKSHHDSTDDALQHFLSNLVRSIQMLRQVTFDRERLGAVFAAEHFC